jgi:hypothetical protein
MPDASAALRSTRLRDVSRSGWGDDHGVLSITVLLLKIVGIGVAVVVVIGLRRAAAGSGFTRAMRAYEDQPLTQTQPAGAAPAPDQLWPAPGLAPDLTTRRAG